MFASPEVRLGDMTPCEGAVVPACRLRGRCGGAAEWVMAAGGGGGGLYSW